MLDPTDGSDDAPKLHVDADWKAEARAEKARLAEKERADAEAKARTGGDAGGPGREGLPEPTFQGLVSLLASQAIMGLGAMQDPESGGVMIDLEGSRFAIDLLGVLEEKTKGNLEDEESKELAQVLGSLRARFVEIQRLVAEQMASGNVGAPGAPGAGGASGLIDPTA